MSMIPSTAHRVPLATAAELNQQIRRQTDDNIRSCAARGAGAISRRLVELDHEWDIERTLEANAATVALIGLSLGAFVDRKFFALPAVVAGFLLQHAVQGWCPPIPIFGDWAFAPIAKLKKSGSPSRRCEATLPTRQALRTGLMASAK
jgi:hypothetical protein